MKMYGVIMAGGSGTRFWPLSRQNNAKQLLNLSGADTMINETIVRISRFIDKKDIFIVTNKCQSKKIAELTDKYIDKDHILIEPEARNTAACIGYAACKIKKRYGDGIMCIFPSDHFIKGTKTFEETINQAVEIAVKDEKLITIGIQPTYPSTGYGYIKFNKSEEKAAKNVIQFVEKPDYETAKSYIHSGEYVWNSGMFIWKASTILNEFERYLPKIYEKLFTIADYMDTEYECEIINRLYGDIPSISIDYGIMERSDNVLMLTGEFSWNDVGSWDSLQALYDSDKSGNIIIGEHININTKNCISYSSGRLIATMGVENLIIVETKDTVMICSKESAQDVKKIVETLQEEGRIQYL